MGLLGVCPPPALGDPGPPGPVSACYISHISNGEHPPNFTVLAEVLCEALLAPAWEGRQGEQHL